MRHLIIGNGVAGVSAASQIRRQDSEAEVIVVSDESPYFYSRTALMWIYMRQLTLRDTEPHERSAWSRRRLELINGRATGLDVAAKQVTLSDGRELAYDRLLLALGGKANMFGWPGQDLDGVCNMTNLRDLARLEAVRPRLERAVVVGGGLIGIEMVEMMLHDRVPVTYLVREPWYWDLALSEEEAGIVQDRLRGHGVDLRLEDEIGEIRGDGRVEGLLSKAGLELPCQLVGVAVGVSGNTELAREAGIDVGRGILTDAALRTSAPDVYAAGDCAEVRLPGQEETLIQKLWYTGQRQGAVAGRAMCGDPEAAYAPGIPVAGAQFLFLDYVTVGWMKKFRPELQEWSHRPAGSEESVRVAHLDGRVQGFSMLGPRWNAGVLLSWIRQRRKLSWAVDNLHLAVFNEEFRRNRFAGVTHG